MIGTYHQIKWILDEDVCSFFTGKAAALLIKIEAWASLCGGALSLVEKGKRYV